MQKMLSAGVDKHQHICGHVDMLHCWCVCVWMWYDLIWRPFEEQSFQIRKGFGVTALLSLHLMRLSTRWCSQCHAVPCQECAHIESRQLNAFLPGHQSLYKPNNNKPILF